ncbi:hypothetical protein PCIT_b0791 [Pseudoalteromonas citrea]|uniref:Uncharacterized protein n=2 Tax=Pseudoalteromonas citrea TaxID=43655 RepID=A0AAD4AEY9_9GAMM|nr:hypothetical protein [Pseudoalteromonas citrea]KAF7764736.1 hypothetical protein PCIT_b0791 [Pseudoalteromonas citrea]
MKIHQPVTPLLTQPPLPSQTQSPPTAKNDSTENSPVEAESSKKEAGSYQLSASDKKRLNNDGEEEKVESKKDSLPQHIQKMIEQIERIKEQIEEEETRLLELKARTDIDKQVKQDMELQQASYIGQLHTNLMSMVENVREAMKEAGITDPGVLISALA